MPFWLRHFKHEKEDLFQPMYCTPAVLCILFPATTTFVCGCGLLQCSAFLHYIPVSPQTTVHKLIAWVELLPGAHCNALPIQCSALPTPVMPEVPVLLTAAQQKPCSCMVHDRHRYHDMHACQLMMSQVCAEQALMRDGNWAQLTRSSRG